MPKAFPHEVSYQVFTTHKVTRKLSKIPINPKGPSADPRIALSTIIMITANIAFPKDALSILAILVPIHKNIESITTSNKSNYSNES